MSCAYMQFFCAHLSLMLSATLLVLTLPGAAGSAAAPMQASKVDKQAVTIVLGSQVTADGQLSQATRCCLVFYSWLFLPIEHLPVSLPCTLCHNLAQAGLIALSTGCFFL